MATTKIISVHVPASLAASIDKLMERRRQEEPWSVPTVSLIARELLARGLEAIAREHATSIRAQMR